MRILIVLLLFYSSIIGSEMKREAASFGAGIVAGASEPLIAQPLTAFKNRAQFGKRNQPLSLKELWRGAPVAAFCLGLNTGIQAGFNALLMSYMHNSLGSSLTAGALSAYIIATIIAYCGTTAASENKGSSCCCTYL